LKIPLSVTGTQAAVSAQPMMLTFPLTIVGASSMPQMVTITNTGLEPLTGIEIEIVGTNPTDYVAGTGMLPTMVAVGQSFQFPVTFQPMGTDDRNAIVVVKVDGLPAPVQITVDGTGKLLSVTCSPNDIEFGNVPTGMPKTNTIVCRNTDSDPIDFVTSFSDFPMDWTINPAMGTLAGAMGGVEGSQQMTVTFNPTASGARTTTLTIQTKSGINVGTVNLDGTGVTPVAPQTDVGVGCSYSANATPPSALALMLLLLGGLYLRRRRLA
jgi:MYXO-CTERM domain-containing protein